MGKIDTKYLQGIKMTGSTEKEIDRDGRKTKTYIPWERPATEEDVLSWKDYGSYLVIAINDGKKYTVEKNPRKSASEEGPKKEDKK